MFLIEWYRQYKQIKEEFKPSDKVCDSCETLKHEIEMLRLERNKLLDNILNPKTIETKSQDTSEMKPIQSTRVPWRVTQQRLQDADRREAAKLIKEKSDDMKSSSITTEELEAEMGIVADERESESVRKDG